MRRTLVLEAEGTVKAEAPTARVERTKAVENFMIERFDVWYGRDVIVR
jgi:hypothetical protein